MMKYSTMLKTISQAAINWHEVINLTAVTLVYVNGEYALTVLIMLILCIADRTHHFRMVSSLLFDQNMDKRVDGIPCAS